MPEYIGWIMWCALAFPALVLIASAIGDAIRGWRWKQAYRRGEIKPRPFLQTERAVYR